MRSPWHGEFGGLGRLSPGSARPENPSEESLRRGRIRRRLEQHADERSLARELRDPWETMHEPHANR